MGKSSRSVRAVNCPVCGLAPEEHGEAQAWACVRTGWPEQTRERHPEEDDRDAVRIASELGIRLKIQRLSEKSVQIQYQDRLIVGPDLSAEIAAILLGVLSQEYLSVEVLEPVETELEPDPEPGREE